MLVAFKRFAPRNGWRVFAGDVGVIVLGVLIAVGIGKVVEALDWRDKVAAAQTTLNGEDMADSVFALRERVATRACLLGQLDRLQADVLSSGTVHRAARHAGDGTGNAFVFPQRIWSSLQWNSVVSDNIPAHMTLADRAFFTRHYYAIAFLGDLNREERIAVADLNLLGQPIVLDPRTRNDLLRAIIGERQRVILIDTVARQTLHNIAGAGRSIRLAPGDAAQMNTLIWCRANGLA